MLGLAAQSRGWVRPQPQQTALISQALVRHVPRSRDTTQKKRFLHIHKPKHGTKKRISKSGCVAARYVGSVRDPEVLAHEADQNKIDPTTNKDRISVSKACMRSLTLTTGSVLPHLLNSRVFPCRQQMLPRWAHAAARSNSTGGAWILTCKMAMIGEFIFFSLSLSFCLACSLLVQ